MKPFAWALAAVSCIVAGTAQAQGLKGVYLHDSAIGTQTDSIDAAAQAASTLKPYDDQLANLTAFAAQEDLAVATQWVAARDFEIQQLIGQPSTGPEGDGRSLLLVARACQRLAALVTLTNPCGVASEQNAATVNLAALNTSKLASFSLQFPNAIEQATLAQVRINAVIADFTRQYPELAPPTCASASSPTEIDSLNFLMKLAPAPATKQRLTNAIAELDVIGIVCGILTDAQKGQATQVQAWINADIANFRRQYPNLPSPMCISVVSPPSPTEIDALNARLAAASGAATRQKLQSAIAALQELHDDCVARDAAKQGQGGVVFRAGLAGDSLGAQVIQAVDADEAAATATANPALQSLNRQLAAVKTAGASETDLVKLQTIEGELASALSDADQAAKVLALNKIDGELGQLATALVCEKTSPPCPTAPSGLIDAKAAATLGVLNAAAQAADVNAGRGDESLWIAAAQAIVAAYKADAQTVVAADNAMQAVIGQSQVLAAQETVLLAKSILLAAGDTKDVSDAVGCEEHGFECALPAYVDSWNEGRAPAAVLAYREVQVFRAFNVQRQRQAAQAQRSLLLAATAALKAYGDGGIEPQTVAQLVQALGIVAIAAK